MIMGIASVLQAITMAIAGHLYTRTGRRALFVAWGISAAILGPILWWATVNASWLWLATLFAALLQIATVAGYGPVSAYLSERFPTEVRSTGYGMSYSLSLILPALYSFYLPYLERAIGSHTAILSLIVLGGVLVIVGALLGPRLGRTEIAGDLDEVARGCAR